MPIERIAVVQKDIMRVANQHATPVITATQMLESMTSRRMPTRAEATDVAALAQSRVDPEDDIHATADYRRHLAGVLTRRGAAVALAAAGEVA